MLVRIPCKVLPVLLLASALLGCVPIDEEPMTERDWAAMERSAHRCAERACETIRLIELAPFLLWGALAFGVFLGIVIAVGRWREEKKVKQEWLRRKLWKKGISYRDYKAFRMGDDLPWWQMMD